MKYHCNPRKRCNNCRVIVRFGVPGVICSEPRHKQKASVKNRKKRKFITYGQ